jgi:hypothetical protein
VDRTTGLYDTRTSCMLCRPVPSFRFDVQCDPTSRELTAGVVLRADSGASTASSQSVTFDSCPFLRHCRLHRPVESLAMTSRQCTVNLPMLAFWVRPSGSFDKRERAPVSSDSLEPCQRSICHLPALRVCKDLIIAPYTNIQSVHWTSCFHHQW